jgi:hypothetical protein
MRSIDRRRPNIRVDLTTSSDPLSQVEELGGPETQPLGLLSAVSGVLFSPA